MAVVVVLALRGGGGSRKIELRTRYVSGIALPVQQSCCQRQCGGWRFADDHGKPPEFLEQESSRARYQPLGRIGLYIDEGPHQACEPRPVVLQPEHDSLALLSRLIVNVRSAANQHERLLAIQQVRQDIEIVSFSRRLVPIVAQPDNRKRLRIDPQRRAPEAYDTWSSLCAGRRRGNYAVSTFNFEIRPTGCPTCPAAQIS